MTQAQTIIAALILLALSGCSAVGEIAYDNKIGREKDACQQLADSGAYRACMERVRAVEREAARVRKEQ
ncbi:hypothetical protein [Paucibacter soli]|uniref:hypothetical protein n=1 Tax=Paucibacter soli TaxID=3133433 RepID=UPI0030990CA8